MYANLKKSCSCLFEGNNLHIPLTVKQEKKLAQVLSVIQQNFSFLSPILCPTQYIYLVLYILELDYTLGWQGFDLDIWND